MLNDAFVHNRYSRTYYQIILRAQSRPAPEVYTERHHVVPRAMGGQDTQSNLVLLTAKEHFVCHHLLTRMCVLDEHRHKMWNAFFLMHAHSTEHRFYTARTFQLAKHHMSEAKRRLTGKRNPYFGKKHSEESKLKMSKSWNKDATRSFDPTLYTFTHPVHGTKTCTQYDFYTSLGTDKRYVNALVKNKVRTTSGWSLA